MGRLATVISLDSFRFELKGIGVQWQGDPFTSGYEHRGGVYDVSGVKSGLGIERK